MSSVKCQEEKENEEEGRQRSKLKYSRSKVTKREGGL
jgi:hypothetical protein